VGVVDVGMARALEVGFFSQMSLVGWWFTSPFVYCEAIDFCFGFIGKVSGG
jgi:hypothetical protein